MQDDKDWADYSAQFRTEVLPKILDSAMFLALQSNESDFDVQMATQLGAAIMLGKPLLVVCPAGRTIPECLRRAADELVEEWDIKADDAQERLMAALKRMTDRFPQPKATTD